MAQPLNLIFQAGALESSRMDVGLGALAAMPRMGSDASIFPAVPVWRLGVAEGNTPPQHPAVACAYVAAGSVPRPLRFCVLKRGVNILRIH